MKRALSIGIAVWVALISLSLFWNLRNNQEQHTAILFQSARSFFQQIEITREWNASHGGLYAPVTDLTQPNPYLKKPLRDLEIDASLTLTKINPAFMTRQIADIANKYNNIQFHITSLNPIRPQNAPTFAEKTALQTFQEGTSKEVGQMIATDSGTSFFYMAPLITKKTCLQCHADQGYKEGDIRGGISVTMPFTIPPPSQPLILGHLLIGSAGIAGMLFFSV